MVEIYLSSIILEGKCSLRWGRKTQSSEAHSNLNGFQTEVGSSTKERPAKILKLGHASFTECTPHFLSNALFGTLKLLVFYCYLVICFCFAGDGTYH